MKCTWSARVGEMSTCQLATGSEGGLCPLHQQKEAGFLMAVKWLRNEGKGDLADRMIRDTFVWLPPIPIPPLNLGW